MSRFHTVDDGCLSRISYHLPSVSFLHPIPKKGDQQEDNRKRKGGNKVKTQGLKSAHIETLSYSHTRYARARGSLRFLSPLAAGKLETVGFERINRAIEELRWLTGKSIDSVVAGLMRDCVP